ncbi:MAG TPA: hypothetical protein VGJ85_06175 [Candidatus Nanopelagicaceae bacterium]|jgi:hypothetical protein
MTKNRETQWAIALATTVSAVVIFSGALFGIAYLVGGSNAVSDNWVGFLVAMSFLGGLTISLLAFVLGITAWIRHGRAPWLWVPVVVFPSLLAFIVLGEIFWWQ